MTDYTNLLARLESKYIPFIDTASPGHHWESEVRPDKDCREAAAAIRALQAEIAGG